MIKYRRELEDILDEAVEDRAHFLAYGIQDSTVESMTQDELIVAVRALEEYDRSPNP